jgi:hypothetical protein
MENEEDCSVEETTIKNIDDLYKMLDSQFRSHLDSIPLKRA